MNVNVKESECKQYDINNNDNKCSEISKYYENVFLEGVLGKSIICPISHQPFEDPVIDISCGCSYERIEIYKWLQDHNVSPISRQEINFDNLVNNVTLRNIIDNLRNKYQNTRSTNINDSNEIKNQINLINNSNFQSSLKHNISRNPHNIININIDDDSRKYLMYKIKKAFTEMKLKGKDEFLMIGRTLERILGCRYSYDIHPLSHLPFISIDTRKAHWTNQIVIYSIHESIRLSFVPSDMSHLHGLDDPVESLFEMHKLYEFHDRQLTEICTRENVIIPTSAGFMRILVYVGNVIVPSANIFILRSLNHLTYKGENIMFWLNDNLTISC